MKPDRCLSGDECGLCFTRTNPQPLSHRAWRAELGPRTPSEKTRTHQYYPPIDPDWPTQRYRQRLK